MNRSRVLFGVLGFAAVLTVGGWVASSRIESPADVAARTAPPAPSPILVPVEQRVLSSNIVTRGTARFGLPQPISIVPVQRKGENRADHHDALAKRSDCRKAGSR